MYTENPRWLKKYEALLAPKEIVLSLSLTFLQYCDEEMDYKAVKKKWDS